MRGVLPATAHSTRCVAMSPREVRTPATAPSRTSMPENLGVLVDFDAAPVGAARVAPRDRVVPRDGARLVVQRAEDRRVAAAVRSICGTSFFTNAASTTSRAHAEVLVDLGAPARGAQVGVRMREREMPARANRTG